MNGLLEATLVLLLAASLAGNVALFWWGARARASLAWHEQHYRQPSSLPEKLLSRLGKAEHAEARTLIFPVISD